MKSTAISRLRAFFSLHGTRIFFVLFFGILTVFSFCICGKPTAGDILIAAWGTTYLLFPVSGIALALSAVLKRYFLALSLFIGYHAGLVLAIVGTDPGEAHFLYGRITVILTMLIAVILGLWIEYFAHRKAIPAETAPEREA